MRHCWAQPLLADPRLFFESRMAATPAAATAPELTAASPPAPPEPALTLTEYSSLALETAVTGTPIDAIAFAPIVTVGGATLYAHVTLSRACKTFLNEKLVSEEVTC